ncbi:ATP-binding protein [Thiomicrorhabdus sp.]|uniref:ATP-binding protein n=1 Tax=Thiomicrorhabdus sp. TaxID=2039724 RepID=UPI0029C6319A|nr:ATP-binding protein [Thiomicrorhabdus sp.]
MGIRLKLTAFLLLFGFLVLGALIWSNQYVLHTTMLQYVDQRDQQRLQRLKNNLQVYLQDVPTEKADQIPERVWLKLLNLSHRIDLTQNSIPMEFILKHRANRRAPPPDEFESRVSLLDGKGRLVYGPSLEPTAMRILVSDGDHVVAQLGYHHLKALTERADIEFAETQSKMLSQGAVLITLLALLLLWPLANHFLTPIRQLTDALKALAAGDFARRLPTDRSDEFGALQRDFNYLSKTLQAAQNSRNQWIADISHELRTPLTVLSGSIEAMRDGIRPLNSENLQKLSDEVALLNRLIEDLYQLSLSDVGALQYRMKCLNFNSLLDQVVSSQRHACDSKGLQLSLATVDDVLWVKGDEARLTQMLNNLLQNSINYTDARQSSGRAGEIRVALHKQDGVLTLRIADSSPGVAEEHLLKLTERFFRTEPSRNRRSGGAGLGLAIVRRIVEAHGGKILLSSSELGGLEVKIELPIATKEAE